MLRCTRAWTRSRSCAHCYTSHRPDLEYVNRHTHATRAHRAQGINVLRPAAACRRVAPPRFSAPRLIIILVRHFVGHGHTESLTQRHFRSPQRGYRTVVTVNFFSVVFIHIRFESPRITVFSVRCSACACVCARRTWGFVCVFGCKCFVRCDILKIRARARDNKIPIERARHIHSHCQPRTNPIVLPLSIV